MGKLRGRWRDGGGQVIETTNAPGDIVARGRKYKEEARKTAGVLLAFAEGYGDKLNRYKEELELDLDRIDRSVGDVVVIDTDKREGGCDA
jgi:hypothetical protein